MTARLLHIAGCLPPTHRYNAHTGTVDAVSENLIEFEAAPQTVAALAR